MKVCTLSDIEVHIADGEKLIAFKCTSSGQPGEELRSVKSSLVYDMYRCNNCGREQTREPDAFNMREHLGKMHDMINPFNDSMVEPGTLQNRAPSR